MTTQQQSQRKQEQYQLSQSEQRYLNRFHKMQNTAQSQKKPQVLLVFFDGRTVSFFDGLPSGIDKGEQEP